MNTQTKDRASIRVREREREGVVTVCELPPGTGTPHDSRDDGRDTDRSASGSRSQLNTL